MTKTELIKLAKITKDLEMIDRLSRDEYGGVREVVAENPKWKAIQESGLLNVARLASKWLNIL